MAARPFSLLALTLALLALLHRSGAFVVTRPLRTPPRLPVLRTALGVGDATLRTAAIVQPAPQHHQQRHAAPIPSLLRRKGGAFHLEPTVVKASLTAVAELLISCGIGAFATRKGVLDRVVISSLSKVVYNLLLPALLFSNVARTVYSRPLASLLPLPGFATMQIALCAVISRVVIALLRVDPKSIKGRELGTYGSVVDGSG